MVLALLLTVLAGLSTSVGGLLALHKSVLKRSVLAVALGFSAGAMIFVSFTEIIPKSQLMLADEFEPAALYAMVFASFFVGLGFVALIDRLIPHSINPSEHEGDDRQKTTLSDKREVQRLLRSGFLVTGALTLHNLPEGLITFISALEDPKLGIAMAIAIAVHNIPEGIAVAAPIFAATKNRRKAFFYTSLSGIAEPIGALAGYALLDNLLPDAVFGLVFSAVAGMMIFISIDELLPAAKRYETSPHQTIYGVAAGMFVVALSLALLRAA